MNLSVSNEVEIKTVLSEEGKSMLLKICVGYYYLLCI